jgi:ribosomal protein S1
VITGEVRSLRPFGAFVDIGGADGLLHVSEIGWSNINHPREALEVGQTIDVQVIRIEPDNQRIALSRKRLLANPWDTVEERYKPGDIIDTKITRIVDFGAFAELEPGIEGLIHISEIADIAVAEPLKTIRVGDEVKAKVLRVDRKRQRVGLSLRQAENELGEEARGTSRASSDEAASDEAMSDEAIGDEAMRGEETAVDESGENGNAQDEAESSETAEE